MAATSSRLTRAPVGAAATGCGCCVVVGIITDGCAPVLRAGRALGTGRVSKATRLMSIKCSGEMLSDVTLPPHEPQPSVIEGGRAVEKPIAPCVVGVLTTTREAGISMP